MCDPDDDDDVDDDGGDDGGGDDDDDDDDAVFVVDSFSCLHPPPWGNFTFLLNCNFFCLNLI
jgi:hypothetical protein